MSKIELDELFSCPPESLWEIVGDVGRADWVPSVSEITVDGDLRRLVMEGAGSVVERIFERDAETRKLVYGVVESAAPLEHHRATLQVSEHDAGCRLVWSTAVEPDTVAPFIREAMAASVARLRELVAPPP